MQQVHSVSLNHIAKINIELSNDEGTVTFIE